MGTFGRKRRDLRDRVGKFIQGQAVARAHQFLDEPRSRILFKFEVLDFAQARIDHQGEVQRLLCFRLEHFNLLLHAFFVDLKLVLVRPEGRAAILVEHAGQHADQADFGRDAAALVLIRRAAAPRQALSAVEAPSKSSARRAQGQHSQETAKQRFATM